MGCSVSKRVTDSQKFMCANGKPSYEATFISVLLQDSNFTRSFVTFVKDSWKQQHESICMYTTGMENISNDLQRKRALNCIDFLIDSHDFLSIPYSRFQCYRGYEIYEKYMMHGSVKGIGISENSLDDCSNKLFQNHQLQDELNAARQASMCSNNVTNTDGSATGTGSEDDEVIDQVRAVIGGVFDCKHIDVRNLFGAAVTEVTDYLETEVFSDFICTYPEAVVGTISMRNLSSRIGHGSTVMPTTPGIVAADALLHGRAADTADPKVVELLLSHPSPEALALTRLILHDSELSKCFRSYLQRVGALCYLESYNELRDICKKLQVAYHSVDLDYRITSILYFLHKFYDKYISRSSTVIALCHFRDVLRASFLDNFTRSPTKIDFESGFEAFESDIYDAIASNLIDGFLLSCECHQYCSSPSTYSCAAVSVDNIDTGVAPCVQRSRYAFIELVVRLCKTYADRCTVLSSLKGPDRSSMKSQYNPRPINSVSAAAVGESQLSVSTRPGMFSVLELLRCFCRTFQACYEGDDDGSTNGSFCRFVQDTGHVNYMQFCYAVYLFKTTTFSNTMERVAAGKKLCEKFISLNAPAHIPLPSCIRDVIYWSHMSLGTDIMDYAVVWTHNRLTQLYWLYLVLSDSAFSSTMQNAHNNILHADGGDADATRDAALTEEGVCYTEGDATGRHVVLMRTGNMVPNTGTKFCNNSVLAVPRNSLVYSQGVASVPADTTAIVTVSSSNAVMSADQLPQGGMSRKDRRSSMEQHAHRLKRASIQWLRKTLCSYGKVTVRDLVNDVDACPIFKEFLEREDAAHLLTFLLEVEEHRGISVPAFRLVYFKQIYYKYIHKLAILHLPISDDVRSMIATQLVSMSEEKRLPPELKTACENVSSPSQSPSSSPVPETVAQQDPSLRPHTFSSAVTEVLNYIDVILMPKLLKSPEYDTMLQLMISNKTKNRGINGCCRRTSIAVENRGLQTTDLQNLHTVLQFQSTSRFFKDFCVRSYCAESLYFWLDVENYQNLSGGTDYMNRTALKIYHKYIVEDANLQINIPASLRKQIAMSIVGCICASQSHIGTANGTTNSSTYTADRFLFRKAQEEVFNMMRLDSFVLFLKSKEYNAMISCVSRDSMVVE